uniref:Immunoglobulin C1-set domain-containing protein n=1 Tax=Nothobranchius furzeri TaxID=105023 RepID=A0A8C6LV53_NOTFU
MTAETTFKERFGAKMAILLLICRKYLEEKPPDVIIYPRNEVVTDEENTLICFINNFFPPKIRIKSFHIFSSLNFVPKDGDIYSCTVEHEALEEPKSCGDWSWKCCDCFLCREKTRTINI